MFGNRRCSRRHCIRSRRGNESNSPAHNLSSLRLASCRRYCPRPCGPKSEYWESRDDRHRAICIRSPQTSPVILSVVEGSLLPCKKLGLVFRLLKLSPRKPSKTGNVPGTDRHLRLQPEQVCFRLQSAREAGKFARRSNYTMAGHNDR